MTGASESGGHTLAVDAVDVYKHYPLPRRGFGKRDRVHSVDGVTVRLERGHTLGLVGESGSGKSTVARLLLGLQRADSGKVEVAGYDVRALTSRQQKAFRRAAQIVFQDPHSAMDPRMTVRQSLGAILDQHDLATDHGREARLIAALEEVGMEARYLDRVPSDCSGGQLQRIVIARALLLEPSVLICDEPTSALDASVQAMVLNLLSRVRRDRELTMIMISHDMRAVRLVSDRVAVMYLGQVVESADRDELFAGAVHPYTLALLAAADNALGRPEAAARGEAPSPVNPPTGCRFSTRCPLAVDRCHEITPEETEVSPGHLARCHRAHETRALFGHLPQEVTSS